jgi:hypothetical protein
MTSKLTLTTLLFILAFVSAKDIILGGYLPEYRDYIQVNQSAAFLTDLYLFSASPSAGMGDKQLNYCCLHDRHYDIARQARAYKGEIGAGQLRVWITIGGAGRSDHFLKDPDGLLDAIRFLVKKHQLDGVVLNCEHFSHTEEYLGYIKWIVKASSELRQEGVLVAVTLHVGQFLPSNTYTDIEQIHLMAYDLHVTYHADVPAVQAAVERLIESGCPAEKVIMGIPAYARHVRRMADVKTFAEIIDEIENSQSSENFGDAGDWRGFRGESTVSVSVKVEWAARKRLGGVFFWELGQDKQHSTAPGGILLEAAATATQRAGMPDEL